MIIKYLLSLSLIPLLLSEPDLCQNPKLDSIAYVSGKFMWFFTSGGYYWYIKESDFPPRSPSGKLPDGFTRGDAVFYSDWIKVCESSPNSRQPKYRVRKNDQLIIFILKS